MKSREILRIERIGSLGLSEEEPEVAGTAKFEIVEALRRPFARLGALASNILV